MGRSIKRSTVTGQFRSNAAAARWPSKTVTERVGSGTSNRRTVYRDGGSGQFVSKDQARRDPGGTMAQRV
ncbi:MULTISPECIES: ABC transporter ATP-binding protein [Cellulosimicrobium]|uniref:ABC transporter ATP-binding protein n=1 Tax=Cellulosimicrobium TaxID=157920 RepID=UPI001BAB5572|nr:ABC transporter ATP-binding protein [Cellulosimicrobium cellulans]QUC01990.1 ABC transporter ATP-binding protein [Cellulosimicrobium cellulans]